MERHPETTPLMQQYRRIRSQLPADTILFFRLGDFYEMFYEDAAIASRVLDIALTRRQQVPMCGVPYHASEVYIAKLIRAGHKVAVCDQLEDPSVARGIVKRDVTSIVTPGTATVDGVLDARRPHYLAAICEADGRFGLAVLDLSTGAFRAEEADRAELLRDHLRRDAPRECVVPEDQAARGIFRSVLGGEGSPLTTPADDWTFEYHAARDLLTRHFGVHSLEGYGCEGRAAVVGAAGGALYYVKERLRRSVKHVRALRVGNPAAFLVVDEATCANLDLVNERGRPGGGPTSLLGVLDGARTAMGSRLLRDWILRPLAERAAIVERHDAVDALVRERSVLHELREALGAVRDLERLIARLGAGTGNARDLRALAQSLEGLPAVRRPVESLPVPRLRALAAAVRPLPELTAAIESAVVDEPPAVLREGGLIRRGYRPELDGLRDAATQGRAWLAEFQGRERERTGIKTLKIGHNNVFGYYIEVSKGQLAHVPAEYERKQTLVNAERFVTPEIREHERRILGAQERAVALEYELFCEVRDAAVRETESIQRSAEAVAELDALASFADRALASGYVRPAMTDDDRIDVRDGRHPVIELMPDAERFVPNDVLLDGAANQLLIITGPNMAGKSTYIRQVALLTIMAQAGSFVPAASATLGVVDRVFTRVGASDDLARGRSTFMVEMQETANILNNATPRSLIVLDEIGRGTSTFDGISIAWAVAEYLHNHAPVKAKTLFATHYHELTDLALTLPGVKNYNVLVREKGEGIVFLRKIVPGAADQSYGIQVARLAGLPQDVIDRAREILLNLEEGELGETGKPKLARARGRRGPIDPAQMTLL